MPCCAATMVGVAEPWRQQLTADRQLVEARCAQELRALPGMPRRLRQAMAHSLYGGGKRLRPLLVLWTHDALGRRASSRTLALRAGAAVEMIHTYSLIHDDLPAMDDDVLRRGRPTCHVAFDEGTAVLAGDGLQALAFGVLADLGPRAAEMVALAARAAGPLGMVGGQQRDLEAEGQPVTARTVERIHAEKTAAMLALSLALGGCLPGRLDRRSKALARPDAGWGWPSRAPTICSTSRPPARNWARPWARTRCPGKRPGSGSRDSSAPPTGRGATASGG